MGITQRGRQFLDNFQRPVRIKRRNKLPLETTRAEIFHRNVVLKIRHANIIDSDDIRMRKTGNNSAFALKADTEVGFCGQRR